jgi:hypothetical protein
VSCVPSTNSCWAVGYDYNPSIFHQQSLVEALSDGSLVHIASYNVIGNTKLLGVSCPSAGACTAVGTYNTPQTSSSIVEHQSGGSFLGQASPTTDQGALNGVSCRSALVCNAVGSRTVGSIMASLYERS